LILPLFTLEYDDEITQQGNSIFLKTADFSI